VNAGSMQENEDQLGLAHFTEHMGFNGIEGYPGNEVVSELQKIGVAFGADLNAYTSFDETVYMVQLPTDDEKYLNMGIDILYGWAAKMLFDHQEIDDERGVITEEYRMGLGADDRMRKKWFPVVFTNSRYADRLPIGTLEVIQGFKYQTIKDFYNDWYRPDLQAIIVVGDFDAKIMEAIVIEKFSKIKPVQNPRPKIIYPVEGNEKPLVSVCTDPEAMGNQVMMIRKFPHFAMKTEGDFRTNLMHELYNTMINSRFSELEQNPNNPFVGAGAGYSHFVGNVDYYVSQGICKENRIPETIETIMREDYRVLQYGFLDTELKRAKEELLNTYEEKSKEVDKTESSTFGFHYVNHYLHNDPIPGAKREFNLAKRHLEGITIQEVNALAKEWITLDNFVVVVLAPEKEGVKVPTEEEVLAIINNKELANVEPYIDTYKEQEMVDITTIVPGTITATKDLSAIGAKELTLSNGIKVVLKKTDFKNDEILFSARSKGGISLYPESDIASVMMASDFVDRAGIAEIDYSSLMKKMKGKKVGIMPSISAISESFNGSTSPKDIEFFFQYLHAFFVNPRYDESVSDLVLNEWIEQLKMIQANPMYKFIGTFFSEANQNDPYAASIMFMDEAFLRKADYQRAFNIYKERFANPADFVFTFVGNFDEAVMNTMLETYLASLKTTPERENFNGKVFKGFPE
ncbi:insulinase family protein, partial [Bacteroidales bacterium OttesenSCG-928-L19]|nr:insulinase family protein [Bacteroidales bacterium OttesenSCG-928-L19]